MKESEARQHRRHEDGYPVQQIASDTFQIRRAIAQDADIISWHRARMFQDMGDVSGDAFEILRAKARTRLEQWIDNRNYIGWLATPVDEPETIVAGAGLQLQPILPRPLDVSTIGEGRQGTIVNVFTEPHGDDAALPDCSLKRLSPGPRTSRSIAWCFTPRTKVDRFTRG